MTLEQMQYFVELYQKKSITKAADALMISRQSLSLVIKKLEEEFQVILFVRLNNGIQPTAAATLLYQNTLTVLSDYAILNHKMLTPSISASKEQTIRIGMSDAIMFIYADEITKHLSSTFPEITFELSYSSSQFYQHFDLYIFFAQDDFPMPLTSPYQEISLGIYSPHIWLSAFSPLSSQKSLTVEMIKNLTPLNFFNIFDSDDYINAFALSQTPIVIKSKNIFLSRMENDITCFTTDIPNIKGELLFHKLFDGHNIVAKKLNTHVTLKILYKYGLSKNFVPIISEILINTPVLLS